MEKNNCRLCQSTDLYEFLDLGFHPHSDQFRKDDVTPEMSYPLRMKRCNNCEFVQLSYVVSPDVLYTEDYLYESSITKTASKHWESFVVDVIEKTNLPRESLVVDIGSNDGTLLSKFKQAGMTVIGIDPCKDVTDIANANGIPTITGFFNKDTVKMVGYKAGVITGSNVFAHIDDLDTVMNDVKDLLKGKGVFVFESPYLGELIRGMEYDTVYHQHLSYLALKPLIKFMDKHGMEIFDVTMSDIHGGCFRCFIARKGDYPVKDIVNEIASKENFSKDILDKFARAVKRHAFQLRELLTRLVDGGASIGVVSAPAKGMTLMNYCKIDKNIVDFITEKSKLKIGRYTPGSHIKIEPDSKLIEEQPDYALLLAWNFKKEIMANNPKFKGKWIIPMPKIQII